MSRQHARQTGFTLLELLIAMTLLGMILVLLFGGLRLGMRSWDASQKQVDSLNSVRSLEHFLRRELSLAYPYLWRNVPERRVAFLGERNKLSFVAPLPSRVGGGGLYFISVKLELEPGLKRQRIVWRHLPVNPQMQDFSGLAETQEMVLATFELGGVEDIWLTYFGQENEGTAARWLDRWESKTRLPTLIRVQVRLPNNSQWPEFVVAPMLSSGAVR